jgi:hypothetical protein
MNNEHRISNEELKKMTISTFIIQYSLFDISVLESTFL